MSCSARICWKLCASTGAAFGANPPSGFFPATAGTPTARGHVVNTAERPSGSIVKLGFVRFPMDEDSAVGEQGGRVEQMPRGHAAGGGERTSHRVVKFGAGDQ